MAAAMLLKIDPGEPAPLPRPPCPSRPGLAAGSAANGGSHIALPAGPVLCALTATVNDLSVQ